MELRPRRRRPSDEPCDADTRERRQGGAQSDESAQRLKFMHEHLSAARLAPESHNGNGLQGILRAAAAWLGADQVGSDIRLSRYWPTGTPARMGCVHVGAWGMRLFLVAAIGMIALAATAEAANLSAGAGRRPRAAPGGHMIGVASASVRISAMPPILPLVDCGAGSTWSATAPTPGRLVKAYYAFLSWP